jgi:L-ascorbate metabolism protein UlaG (beta-lactamase superfamily)
MDGGIFMYASDVFKTKERDLEITFIGHGTLMFTFGDLVVHVDPVSMFGDYSGLPKADLILITHEHHDHLDMALVGDLRKDGTVVIGNQGVAQQIAGCIAMKNGDEERVHGLRIEAVPAYNIQHMRSPGNPFHPPGVGNGYVIAFGELKVYVAGDTENIPEMKKLEDIDISFLPMNLPYTMTPEMVADSVRMFNPKIVYPYHFGDTDASKLEALLADADVEVRIRDLQ